MDAMDRILGLLSRQQSDIQDTVRTTPPAESEHRFCPELEKINDSVYSVHSPAEGKRPSAEIILFHGLQVDSSHDPYITSWVSRDQSKPELWVKWILEDEELEDARILLISYDAHMRKTNEEGRMDMHNTSENLILDLIDDAQVGYDGCPVILVGHCLGGLLMKEFCVQAQERIRLQDKDNYGVQNFLANVQGFFCYGSPHHGTELADISAFSQGPLFKGLTTLNDEAARRNEKFRNLRQKYGWRTFGIGETLPANLDRFKRLVVEEASARHDVDDYYTAAADHFNICRPESRSSSIFLHLKNFVSEVVEKDKFRQGPTLRISKNVVGLEPQLDDIRDRLFTWKKQRLGIVGIGGIGKTTLAKVVYNAILGYFEYACFLTEVKKMNRGSLRDEIKRSLYCRGRRVNEAFKWSDLKGKRVLIVLDDITDESHVQVITEDESLLSSQKCTVIVTAREKRFLVRENFECHFMGKLPPDASKELFCKHAFRRTALSDEGQQFAIPKPFETLVERFLEKCDGLPLAIEVAGRYVYDQSKDVWVAALEKLGRHPLDGNPTEKLTSILNMSYENLAPIEQEMFLDVAHCFHGHKLSLMKRTWEKCGCESSASGWRNLLDRGLVTEELLPEWWDAEGDSRYVIQMHELLRDVGLSKPCPESGSHYNQENTPILKIGFHDGVNDVGYDIFEEVDGLRNRVFGTGRSSGEGHHIPNRLFLKVKHLHRWISSALIAEYKTLRTLEIKECKYLLFLPRSLGQLQSLEHLKILDCAYLEDVSESMGLLSNLKHLTIQGCESLSALPESLGELKGLQQLTIQGCGSLITLPECLGRLQGLERLAIKGCHSLEALPHSLGKLAALKQLTISECSNLQILPNCIEDLQALQHLMIQSCGSLEAVPRYLGELGVLEYLTIEDCCRLETLPPNLEKLPVLKYLKISDCTSLHTLPESITLLPALERLTLQGCHSLEALPKSLGHLRSLQRLTLERCHNLVALPESLGQLRSLQHLTLDRCDSLVALPVSLGQLEGLQRLTINCCQGLESLLWTFEFHEDLQHVTIQKCESLRFLPFGWPGTLQQRGCHATIEGCPIEDLQPLKHLTIQCQSLEHLPKSFGNLPALEHLTRQDCQCLKDIPASIEELGALTQLTIRECPSLEHLPENIGRVRALKCLTIEWCQNLKGLPGSIGHLQALECLTIQGCESLKDLPQSIEELGVLTNLTIQECPSLEHLPDNIGRVRALKYLTIELCRKLKGLPRSIGHLQALERLTIQGCESLKDLPENIGRVRALKCLTIERCRNLKGLPGSIGHLQALERLTIQECRSFKDLPPSIVELGVLTNLTIQGCPCLADCPESVEEVRALTKVIQDCQGLNDLTDSIEELGVVRSLTIQDCQSLESLPENLGRLRTLRHLTIQRCQNLKKLPKSIGDLGRLRYLTIQECESLEELPDSIEFLQALEHLTIQRCQKLRKLPRTIWCLDALEHLTLQECESLEQLAYSFGCLRALEHLMIQRCQKLKELPVRIGEFQALRYLTIQDCESLEQLPYGIGYLSALEHLTIQRCQKLKELPRSIWHLQALEHLTIQECSRLRDLASSIRYLQGLKYRSIQECQSLEDLQRQRSF